MIHLPWPLFCRCGVMHRRVVEEQNPYLRLRPYYNIFVTNTLKNLMLGAIATASATNPDFGGLHTAYSNTGANELTGGSPAYARKALTWSTPASGATSLAATFPVWDVPAGQTVSWWSGWDAVTSGTFLFMAPIGATAPINFSADTGNITDNLLAAETHGLTTDTRVVFWPGSGTGLPAPLAVGTIYWVIATGLTADVFSVSTTQGGSAVDITDEGAGFVQKCAPETYTNQGTLTVTSATIDLAALI